MILLKIAFRNLREHKIKTLIIGSLIALGIAFLVIGNSVSQTITKGMEKSYTDNFTGDIIFRNTSDDPVVFVGGFAGRVPALENIEEIEAQLAAHEAVEQYTPMLTGAGSVSLNDELVGFSLLWSVKAEEYRKMFEGSFRLLEGQDLVEGERGIVMSQDVVESVFEENEVQLKIGDVVQLTSVNDTTGTKIREVPIIGIGEYVTGGSSIGGISFVDASTLRSLSGLTAFKASDEAPAEETPQEDVSEDALFGESSSLDTGLEGDLFGGGDLLAEVDTTSAGLDFDNILGDVSVREKFLALDNNAWHFMLVKLKDGFSTEKVKADLAVTTAEIAENAVVENWRFGAGFFAGLARVFAIILNVLIVIVALVAVIIIMNTLVISVTERFGEIGTVRAIGGQRGFVRSMITLEVLMITIIFGIIGILIGVAVVALFNSIGFKAPNEFLEIFFGGPTLKPTLSVFSVVISFFVMMVIGIFASLYPVSVALGISPVQAMQSN